MKLLIIIIVILMCSCSDVNRLIPLSTSEIVKRLHNNEFDYVHATYQDSLGQNMTPELKTKLNRGELARDFYVESNTNKAIIRVRDLNEEDILNEIVIRGVLSFTLTGKNNIYNKEIDCDSITHIINRAYELDQGVRKGTVEGRIFEIDQQNQEIILSMIKKCKWETVPESMIPKIFYVFQHMPDDYMAVNFPYFKYFADKGILELKELALMEDRLRMNNGFPQKFGTQYIHKSFYQIADPINVNKHRHEYGLDSIEKVARRLGIDFNPLTH